MELLLISAPGEPTPSDTRRKMDEALRESCKVSDLRIPQLKIGTLDTLVQLSEDLGKMDFFSEGVAHKVAQFLAELPGNDKDKLVDYLTVNGRSLDAVVSRFEWDAQRFNTGGFVRDVAGEISQKVSLIETEMKARMQAFNKVKGNVQALERKSNGSLLVRTLNDVVKADQFVLDSEYLVTLLVVVPKNLYADWQAKYSTLTDFVVPNSSELLYEDGEYGLYSVTVFRKIEQDFKGAARDNKFVVRDFVFSADDIQAQKAELVTLQSELTKRASASTQWGKNAFGETFSCWIHIKVLRVFVESVLRYGLPINNCTTVVQPLKGKLKQARKILAQLFAHLDSASGRDAAGREVQIVEIAGIGISGEYQPYVSFSVDIAHFP